MRASPLDRLEEAISSLIPLLPRLEAAVAPGVVPKHAATGSSASSSHPSRPPWNPAAAYAAHAVWYESRESRQALRLSALGTPRGAPFPVLHRPVCDLEALPLLAASPRVPVQLSAEVAGHAQRWLLMTHLALGLGDDWRPIPRAPQQQPPCCPYCRLHSLRFESRKGLVRCVTPGCRDQDGARPLARVEYRPDRSSPGDYYAVLAWRDSTEGLAAE